MAWQTGLVRRLCEAVLAALIGQLITRLENCAYEVTGKLPTQTTRCPWRWSLPIWHSALWRPRVTLEVITVTQRALLTKVNWMEEGQSHGPRQAARPGTHHQLWGRSGSSRAPGGLTCWLGAATSAGNAKSTGDDPGGALAKPERRIQRGPTQTGHSDFPGPQKPRLWSGVPPHPATSPLTRFRRPQPGPAGPPSGRHWGRREPKPAEPSSQTPGLVEAHRGDRRKPGRMRATHQPPILSAFGRSSGLWPPPRVGQENPQKLLPP